MQSVAPGQVEDNDPEKSNNLFGNFEFFSLLFQTLQLGEYGSKAHEQVQGTSPSGKPLTATQILMEDLPTRPCGHKAQSFC